MLKSAKEGNGVCLWVWSPRFTTTEQINTMAPSTISVMYITLSSLNIYTGRSFWGNILSNSEEFEIIFKIKANSAIKIGLETICRTKRDHKFKGLNWTQVHLTRWRIMPKSFPLHSRFFVVDFFVFILVLRFSIFAISHLFKVRNNTMDDYSVKSNS